MSYTFKNAAGSTVYAESGGAGSSGDPFVPFVGSKMKEIIIANAVAASTWGTTAQLYSFSSAIIDGYKSAVIHFYLGATALDQALKVQLDSSSGNLGGIYENVTALASGAAYAQLYLHPGAAAANRTATFVATWAQVPFLGGPLAPFYMRWAFPTAATTGAVTIKAYLWG